MRDIDDIQEDIDEKADEIMELELKLTEDAYDELLDEIYGDIDVCGVDMPASQVLNEVDPIRYNVGKSDYDSEHQPNLDTAVEEMEKLEAEMEEADPLED